MIDGSEFIVRFNFSLQIIQIILFQFVMMMIILGEKKAGSSDVNIFRYFKIAKLHDCFT